MKKTTGFILVAVIILGAGSAWYWNTHKKKIIRTQLEKTIAKKSQGLYKIRYGNLGLDEVNGSLTMSSLTITYDSSRLEELKRENKTPYLLFNISIPEIKITGIETPRAFIEKEISGRHLALVNPLIEIIYTNAGKDSTRNVPDEEIYRQILGNLRLIRFDSVIISNAEMFTKNLRTGKSRVHFEGTSISLFDMVIDSTANADTSRILFAKKIDAACKRFTWQSRNGLYNYQVDSFRLQSSRRAMSIRNFFIRPVLSEEAFARKFATQKDRFDFVLRNIEFRNTAFSDLLGESIIADTLIVGSASFKIYRDRNRPEDRSSKLGKYPHQEIQKIPVPFEIKKAMVRKVYIEYKERSTITHQAGRLQLLNTSARISNITNRKASIARNNLMVVDMQSSLLGKIPLSSKWTFYLGNTNGRFAVSGRTGGGEAPDLNVLVVPMGSAEFKSGHINSLSFDLSGSDNMMKGNLKLLYKDFHITILKKDDDSVHFKKRRVVSLFANMKIKNNNPEDDDKPARVANIHIARDARRSIFNLVWKGLFAGMNEITGAKK
ncbi:MAG TPA: hypothetical protein VFI06_02685 [Chitinophagaceae bacterium]|nr:hypothetical protein [Chitinophagaceae bacterium]